MWTLEELQFMKLHVSGPRIDAFTHSTPITFTVVHSPPSREASIFTTIPSVFRVLDGREKQDSVLASQSISVLCLRLLWTSWT